MNLWNHICEWWNNTPDYIGTDGVCSTYKEIDCTDYVQREIYCSDDTSSTFRSGCLDLNLNRICDEEEENHCHNTFYDDAPVWGGSSWLDDCDGYGYDNDD